MMTNPTEENTLHKIKRRLKSLDIKEGSVTFYKMMLMCSHMLACDVPHNSFMIDAVNSLQAH